MFAVPIPANAAPCRGLEFLRSQTPLQRSPQFATDLANQLDRAWVSWLFNSKVYPSDTLAHIPH